MRKRNHVVPVRLNAKELRHLDGQVAKSGLSREEFLRSLILGAQLQTVIRTHVSRTKRVHLHHNLSLIHI